MFPAHPILRWLSDLDDRRDRHTIYEGEHGEAPVDRGFIRAGIRRVEEVVPPPPDLTVQEAREQIRQAMRDYMEEEDPAHVLLIRVTPGVGKTTAAVALAEELAARELRVLYAAPRRDFYKDVMRIAKNSSWWYQWEPRHEGTDERAPTCEYTREMTQWLNRGYKATNFCVDICGAQYMRTQCRYHAQKKRRERIIFGQHQHVILGHPIEFDVVIGDENPVNAFTRRWRIPARHICPEGVDLDSPMGQLLMRLNQLAQHASKKPSTGEELIKDLGGAWNVRSAAQTIAWAADGEVEPPDLYHASEVVEQPYAHIPILARELHRECERMLHGDDVNGRVAVYNGDLYIALRHEVNPKMPKHIIWLDATANERVYESLFGRPIQVVHPQVTLQGRVFQVWDRANGITSLRGQPAVSDGDSLTASPSSPAVEPGAEDVTSDRARQLIEQIRQIIQIGGYTAPGIITHKAIRPAMEAAFPQALHGHFGGSRGTNEFEGCDGLIVAGTPLPPPQDIVLMAKMIFYNRDEPFNVSWQPREMPYTGQPWAHPLSGYWEDADLAAVLWQCREAELIQAAHRIRLSTRAADLWLLTNVPVAELPPTRLVTVRELFLAPPRVDPYDWGRFRDLLDYAREWENPVITAPQVVDVLSLAPTTASTYVDLAPEWVEGWERVSLPTQGRRGRPPKALRFTGPRRPSTI